MKKGISTSKFSHNLPEKKQFTCATTHSQIKNENFNNSVSFPDMELKLGVVMGVFKILKYCIRLHS